jgi:small subunit ribosomal protein S8
MTMTDPIADMLTRLRNGNQAYHDVVAMPYSKIKANIAEVLKQEGYVTGWSVEEPAEGTVGKKLSVELKFGQNRERSLAGIRRAAQGARRSGRRDHLDVAGAADRQAGSQARRGRGSPRLRLVRELLSHVSDWT